MEYNITDFTNELRSLMYDKFPLESEELKMAKHKKTPLHIRDVAFMQNEITVSEDQNIFEIGNVESEEKYPYYHILEDAPVIRKRGKGTNKTKGSQAQIEKAGKRDYGRVSWNGKTFSKEYTRNVRGSRNRIESVSHWTTVNGVQTFVNREANSYSNIHYHYIEKMLNGGILDTLADMFGLKRARTIDTGLADEYAEQEGVSVDSILETFGSFDE